MVQVRSAGVPVLCGWGGLCKHQHAFQLIRADDVIDFRDLFQNLLPVALHQASGHYQFPAVPNFLYSAISKMVLMDSCLAGSMKAQVLTMIISAWSGRGVSSYPCWPGSQHHLAVHKIFGTARLTIPTLA